PSSSTVSRVLTEELACGQVCFTHQLLQKVVASLKNEGKVAMRSAILPLELLAVTSMASMTSGRLNYMRSVRWQNGLRRGLARGREKKGSNKEEPRPTKDGKEAPKHASPKPKRVKKDKSPTKEAPDGSDFQEVPGSVLTPPCPPYYDPSYTDYEAGETIEIYSYIFTCLPSYEKYCNMVDMDSSWNDAEKKTWENAWAYVGPCDPEMPGDDSDSGVDPVDLGSPGYDPDTARTITTVTPTWSPTLDPTLSPSLYPTWSPTPEPTSQFSCPNAYDPAKTTYAEGETVELNNYIFQCHEAELGDEGEILEYEMYCNTPYWDESLSDENGKAKSMWLNAWVLVGPCEPSSWEGLPEDVVPEDITFSDGTASESWASDGSESNGNDLSEGDSSSTDWEVDSWVEDQQSYDCSQTMCTYELTETCTMKYLVNQDSISIELSHEGYSWLGLALSRDGNMIGSEAVIGLPDDNAVRKYVLAGKGASAIHPMVDEHQTLTNASIEFNGDVTVMKFTKLLDEEGEINIFPYEMTTLLFAHGNGGALGYHGHSRMAFDITFLQ
ncbi:hypothetical protein ACHAWF_018165, partial [Thalassiosira exigua]